MEQSPNEDQQRPSAQPGTGGSGANTPSGSPDTPERERPAPLIPDVLGPDEEEYTRRRAGYPFGGSGNAGGPFGPRSFGGGRVQVYGCTPGCLIISLLVSVVLSVVLTLLLNLIF